VIHQLLLNDNIVLLDLCCYWPENCESQAWNLYVCICGMWLLMMLLSMIMLVWGDVVIDILIKNDVVIDNNIDNGRCCYWW